MSEPQKMGFIRQKLAAHAKGTSEIRKQAIAARRSFYEATRGIDNIIKIVEDPDALTVALKPFLEAAAILRVSPPDEK